MAFGLPAYHTDSYTPDPGSSCDLHAAARRTLLALGWRIREDTNHQIVASISVNFSSWGEKILISFLPKNTISVTSKCTLPIQYFDWGKNKMNVGKFMAEIGNHVTATQA